MTITEIDTLKDLSESEWTVVNGAIQEKVEYKEVWVTLEYEVREIESVDIPMSVKTTADDGEIIEAALSEYNENQGAYSPYCHGNRDSEFVYGKVHHD